MKAFMDKDFMLQSATAQHLYHDYAAAMPICDYHCHIPPREIYENRRFENITQVWLGGRNPDGSYFGDHYKWRVTKRNKKLVEFLHKWCYIKNEFYKGDAGLQFSINTTNDEERNYLFSGSSLSLGEISEIGKSLPMPVGRKYALNFALADDTHIDGKCLRELFNPDKFMCKITPLHRTNSCDENDLHTSGGYELFTPYKAVEEDLKGNGFDVIVFVPSYDEDNGLITCGNAILSGKVPTSSYQETIY